MFLLVQQGDAAKSPPGFEAAPEDWRDFRARLVLREEELTKDVETEASRGGDGFFGL